MGVQITTLDNGLRIVTDYDNTVESVALGIWVGAGTRNESPEQKGISHLLEHMAFKGTKTRTAYQIAEEMDNIGGQLNAYTTREHTAYYAKVLKEDTETAMDILSDILINPIIIEEEFDREQKVVVQEILQSHDTPDEIVFDYFQETAFPEQPMGWPVLGTVNAVKALKPENLHEYMKKNYLGAQTVVSASGNINHDKFINFVNKSLSSMNSGCVPDSFKPEFFEGSKFVEKPIEQTHIVLGFEGLSLHHDEYFALCALSVILGEGLSSRLFQEVREKRGLAYSVFSSVNSYSDSGLFTLYAGSTFDQVRELIEVMLGEILKIREGVLQDEVERAKIQLRSGLLMGLESTDSRCFQRARQVLIYGKPLDHYLLLDNIASLDVQKISSVAKNILNNRIVLSKVGQNTGMNEYNFLGSALS